MRTTMKIKKIIMKRNKKRQHFLEPARKITQGDKKNTTLFIANSENKRSHDEKKRIGKKKHRKKNFSKSFIRRRQKEKKKDKTG